ncbi:MAG: alpha/beta fold hydrolase [Planctomycetes bacterium]|nr:alpha/beta fold hydrolase [Planctomycetota bacterium]
MPPKTRPTRSRRARRLRAAAIALAALVVCGCVVNPFDVRDFVVSLERFGQRGELQAAGGTPPLVVLQHGMLRSSLSFWRLEAALRDHGYQVLNPSYPSTDGSIETHARRLGERLEAWLAARPDPPPAIHFVGHSLGGLVIRSYLSQPGARAAASCVFLGTPQRGAALAAKNADRWLFETFGGEAAMELVPGHPFYDSLRPLTAPRIGCLYGMRGDAVGYSADIPGDDDARVGVTEAQLPEQTDAIGLRLHHTWLSQDDPVIRQVLHFLKFGGFRKAPD